MQLTSGVDVSRMCVGKRQTLWATVVTVFSHMTKDVLVFVKCDTIFKWFSWKLPQIRTSKFCKVVRQHTEGVVCYMGFVGNLLLFPAAKELWKSVKNWQSCRHECGVLLLCDTVYNQASFSALLGWVGFQVTITIVVVAAAGAAAVVLIAIIIIIIIIINNNITK